MRAVKFGRDGFRSDGGMASGRLDRFASPKKTLKPARLDRGCIDSLCRHKLAEGRGPSRASRRVPSPEDKSLRVRVLPYPHLLTSSALAAKIAAWVNAPADLNSCQISQVGMHPDDVLSLSS